MVAWWWLIMAFGFGFACCVASFAFVWLYALRSFDRHEAEIDRRNAGLEARIKRGCRRTVGGI